MISKLESKRLDGEVCLPVAFIFVSSILFNELHISEYPDKDGNEQIDKYQGQEQKKEAKGNIEGNDPSFKPVLFISKQLCDTFPLLVDKSLRPGKAWIFCWIWK